MSKRGNTTNINNVSKGRLSNRKDRDVKNGMMLDETQSSSFVYQDLERKLTYKTKQRHAEASKQMLYDVYANVIRTLEEFEARELQRYQVKHNMPQSKICFPDQKHKTFDDIKSNVECQLLLFETQTKCCPDEVLAQVREELKRRTLRWTAVRAEMGIEILPTDSFITQLYEILTNGSTYHKPINEEATPEKVMKNGMQEVIIADHHTQQLDNEYKTNPDKKATSPSTRSSEMFKEGAKRISQARRNQDLDADLEEDVEKMEQDGPDDTK